MTDKIEALELEQNQPEPKNPQQIAVDIINHMRNNTGNPDQAREILYIVTAELLVNALRVPGIQGQLRDPEGNIMEVSIAVEYFKKEVKAEDNV
jgi:hypothetical protein